MERKLIAGKIYYKKEFSDYCDELVKLSFASALVQDIRDLDDPDMMESVVCEILEISKEDLRTTSRKREIVQAKYLCMYYLRKKLKINTETIAHMFGYSDHTAAVRAVYCVENLEIYEDLLRIFKQKMLWKD